MQSVFKFAETVMTMYSGLDSMHGMQISLGPISQGICVCVMSAAEPWEPAVPIFLAGSSMQPKLAVKVSSTGTWIQICML